MVTDGVNLLEVISQFWLCQNPSPVAASILTDHNFEPTTAAVLNCLEVVVMHLNAHEAARVKARAPEDWSYHSQLRAPMYHFFKIQLEKLPDVSARVAKLIREALPPPLHHVLLDRYSRRLRCNRPYRRPLRALSTTVARRDLSHPRNRASRLRRLDDTRFYCRSDHPGSPPFRTRPCCHKYRLEFSRTLAVPRRLCRLCSVPHRTLAA